MDFGIRLKCPYCGIEDGHTVEGRRGSELVRCDRFEEMDGCGCEYVLVWKLEVVHTIRKIEGEQAVCDERKKEQAAHGGDQG